MTIKYIDTANLTNNQGFRVSYPSNIQGFGDLSSLGDINGDGYDDIIIGDPKEAASEIDSLSTSYVIFGNINGYSDLSLENSSGYNGFKITSDKVLRPEREDDDFFYGPGTIYLGGHSVSSASDINGDGYDDIVIGARYVENKTGVCYVIFGHSNNFTNIHLNNMSYSQGFSIFGKNIGDFTCDTVSKAGDVNADGYKDIIIGAPSFYYSQNNHNGTSYVLFGKANYSNIYLSNLTLDQGFYISGIKDSYNGYEVSGAGDLNGDGYDEVITVTIGPNEDSTHAYVIFGKAEGFSNIYLPDLSYSQGYKIMGAREPEVSGLGDVNGDGLSDIIISSPGASYSGGSEYAGISYVIFGSINGVLDIDLNSFSSTQGFKIYGKGSFDQIGESLDGVGDFNGDGVNDILLGSSNDDEGAYLIFGRYNGITDIYLSNLTSNQGLFIAANGEARRVSGAGDINGDGYKDILIGCLYEDYSDSGYKLTQTNYLIYGASNGFTPVPTMLQTFSPTENYSSSPSLEPSLIPTDTPTTTPTLSPTKSPSFKPSASPSKQPTKIPSFKPSIIPSKIPTFIPTREQTEFPTFDKNNLPSNVINLSNKDLINIESNDLVYVPLEIGDFNNDGLKDYFIYGQNGNNEGPVVTVGKIILSESTSFLDNLNDDNNSENLIRLTYSAINNFYPAVSDIGDYNLDGLSDIAFCVYSIQTCFIIYGTSVVENIHLPDLGSSTGFKITDTSKTYTAGYISTFGTAVAGGFDFDGDDKADFIINDYSYNNFQGRVYLILGKANLKSDIDLNLSSGQEGIIIFSGFIYNYVYNGYSLSTAVQAGASLTSLGDYNGDGYDDIGISSAASIYVVYGSSDANGFSLDAIPYNRGFTYTGNYGDTTFPAPRVKSIGDFNGDSLQDIAICHGIYHAKGLSVENIGVVTKIILGNTLNNNNPAIEIPNACSGMPGIELGSATKVYDVNGDGYDDFFISKTKLLSIASSKYFFPSGYYYLIFGNPSILSNINLDNIDSNQGVIFLDDNTYNVVNFQTSFQSLGNAISIGDLNKDGYKDFLLYSVSKIYLIYGRDIFIKGTTSAPSIESVTFPTILPNHNNTSSPLLQPTSEPSSFPTSKPSTQPTLKPSEGSEVIYVTNKIYAILSREVYANPDHEQLLSEVNENGSRLPSGWTVLLDSESAGIVSDTSIAWGFFAKAYKNDINDNVIVAFQGTDDLYDLFSADKDLALGKVPAHYSPAKEFVDYIIDYYQLNPSVISFTGHSLGGFLAQLMSATYNNLAVVFDSPGAGKVIDDYYRDSSYSIIYSIDEIADKVKCFNSAPNLVNIASGSHFGNVIRIFPEYDPNSFIYTLQQHDMSNILLQFKTISGDAKISSAMNRYWEFSGNFNNWPFFESKSLSDSISMNNFLNEIFFNNYNQNPYFWELAWDKSPNINSLSLASPSTSLRIQGIKSMSGLISNSDLTITGMSINGDNSGNKFFGGTNYADIMNGGTGNDEYYPFSGMDIITDSGGENNYYFYTHNMKGTTKIIDQDKTGKINFVNIGCSIGKVYNVDEGDTNSFAFFPIFDNYCNLNKYSSRILESLISSNSINHQNDIVLMKYSENDLIISYNNNEFSDVTNNKILISNFKNKDLGIFIENSDIEDKYVAVGGKENEQFICSNIQDSILAGLGGVNTYFIPLLPNKFSCSIISNDQSSNVYKFTLENYSKASPENSRALISSGSIDIFGLKAIDIIDVSSLKLNDFSALSYQYSVNGTSLNLPGGLSINLYKTEIFLLTIDGDSFAFYNSSAHNYTTNVAGLGINMTELLNAYDSTPDNYYVDNPTYLPTISPESSNEKEILTEGEISGIVIGSLSLIGLLGYASYAYNYNIWPFAADLAKVAHAGVIEEV